MENKDKDIASIDAELRRSFRTFHRNADENQWFTRKVINRLPERHGGIMRLLSFLTAVLGIAAAVIFVKTQLPLLAIPVITLGNMLTVAALLLGAAGWISFKLLKTT